MPEGLGPQLYPDPFFTNSNFPFEFSPTCAFNPASCGKHILFSFGESAWCGAGWRRAASRESPIVRMREFQGGIFLIDRTILSGKTSVQNVMYLSFISDHLDLYPNLWFG